MPIPILQREDINKKKISLYRICRGKRCTHENRRAKKKGIKKNGNRKGGGKKILNDKQKYVRNLLKKMYM